MLTEKNNWNKMKKKTELYMERWNMVEEGSHIIAGISGGADSVCLLFVLLEWRKKKQIRITAVHVNHMLRGKDAEHDEHFVRRLCQMYDVPCRIFRIPVAEEARRRKCSEEEAGREIRRECMNRILEEEHADRIAFAHHQDDHAETVLMNMIRGTGVKGMRGIRPRAGRYIRPMLCVRKKEIEEVLLERKQEWCTDATNLENTYTRNKIRNLVMKELEEINPKAVVHISQMSDKIAEIWEYMEAEMESYKKKCLKQREETWIVEKEAFDGIPEPLKKDTARRILAEICGKEKDITAVHVENFLILMKRQVGRQMMFPYGVQAEKEYEGICFRKGRRQKEKEKKMQMRINIFPRESGQKNWPEKPYTKWFDYDIIKSRPVLRNRESGDYITIDRQGNRQKIKRFFINEKIPQEKRNQIPLIADGSEIMWVIGYRQNSAYQITENTKMIMEIEIYGGE